MADSQPEQNRENRFSKALFARISSVGLFVALGTAAVVFMMNRGQGTIPDNKEPIANADATPVEQKGFASQVQASFSDSFNPSGNPSQDSSKPATASNKNELGSTKLPSFQPNAQPNESKNVNPPRDGQPKGPPERFAALNGVGRPAAQIDPLADKQNSPNQGSLTAPNLAVGSTTKPPTNDAPPINAQRNALESTFAPNPAPSLARGNQSTPASGELAAFDPNPAKSTSAPSSDRNDSEPLKPFNPPNLTSRLVAVPGTDAPKLTAPVPNLSTEQKSFESEPPQVANKPLDGMGEQSSGILKPYDPPASPPSNGLNRSDNFAGNPQPTQVNSPSGNPFDRALATDNGSRATDNGLSKTSAPSNPPAFNQLPSRVNAQPASTPISNGSPINQPTGESSRQPWQNGMSASAPPELRTANVPGDRRLEGLQAPSLAVEKLSPKEISVNEVADFIIVVRNVGRVDASEVIVYDQVPANTEFQGATPAPQQNPQDRRLSWNLGTVKAGQERRIQYQLKPTSPGEIGSVAQVTFSTQASMRTVVTNPVLEIIHRTKPVAMIGSDVVLDVMITNKGNGPAKNVLIQEDVPPQLRFQEGFRELEYEVGTLMPGQTKRVQLGLKAVEVGRLKNIIIATAAGGQKTQHELDLEVVAPKLAAVSDGPTKRYLGRQVAHQFKITNPGTASATNVDLVAKLPAGLRFVKANNQGVYRQANHSVVWSMAELTANGEALVELTTMPVDVGNQEIRFDVNADLNQQASLVQPLDIEHLVDIFFDIDDLVDPIEVGADTAYQIKIANQGTQPASNIQLQADFPNGMLPTTVEGNLQNQVNGQRVQFAPINNLKPGEQASVIIRAKGQIAGDHRIVVTLQADGRESAVAKEEITRVYSDR